MNNNNTPAAFNTVAQTRAVLLRAINLKTAAEAAGAHPVNVRNLEHLVAVSLRNLTDDGSEAASFTAHAFAAKAILSAATIAGSTLEADLAAHAEFLSERYDDLASDYDAGE